KIIRRGSSPDFHEKIYTRKKAHAPPKKANNGVKKNNVGKKETIKIVKNPAPDDTPIIPGSARGLRITACNNTPDTAKAAPANSEMILRGNCKSIMITTFSLVSVNRPFIRSTADTSILPVIAE